MFRSANIILFLIIQFELVSAQIANFVNNPGFEELLPSATLNPYEGALYWGALDSLTGGSHRVRARQLGSVPIGFGGYQWPRSGNNFIVTQFYCDISTCVNEGRWYPRNRLKSELKSGAIYCVKYFVNTSNTSPVAINQFGAFLGGAWLDTTKYCAVPISYLTPQVQYTAGLISDTLNWTAISGTFAASGGEKYIVLGNFASNAATQTIVANSNSLPNLSADLLIDDVSIIDVNLPAYAGPDLTCIPGDSVFIGREPDVGIDEACTWFKLPNTSVPIATVAGLFVKPVSTSTYVVRQQLWCSGVKYDTVVVYEDAVGLNSIELLQERLLLFPQPASGLLTVTVAQSLVSKVFDSYQVVDQFGAIMADNRIESGQSEINLDTSQLPEGCYVLQFQSQKQGLTVRKRLLIIH